jgi:hypothetical protein
MRNVGGDNLDNAGEETGIGVLLSTNLAFHPARAFLGEGIHEMFLGQQLCVLGSET